ncbi:MAG: DUF4339 domain-containing protein, partial [Flavobacteriaceae bacterium]|nr:DUF4339 domain-containing protein [Flavobacteriaceae bacterium]
MEWFVIKENEHFGPYSEQALRQMHFDGIVHNSSLIWREGFENPKSYNDVFYSSSKLPPIPTEEEYLRDLTRLEVESVQK